MLRYLYRQIEKLILTLGGHPETGENCVRNHIPFKSVLLKLCKRQSQIILVFFFLFSPNNFIDIKSKLQSQYTENSKTNYYISKYI